MKEVRAGATDTTDGAIMFGRKDQSLTDVEVVLTDRVTELSGRIEDDGGRPAVDAHVIVFSTDRERWYPASRFLGEVTVAHDGVYRAKEVASPQTLRLRPGVRRRRRG